MTIRGDIQRRGPWPVAALAGLLACLAPLWLLAADLPLVTAEDLEAGFSIEGQWQFQPGDNLAWADPNLNDNDWGQFNLPELWTGDGFPAHNQMAWYRLSLRLSPNALDHPTFANGLGLQIGKVMSAYEVYANGRLLGGAGKLPPLARAHYDETIVHFLPRDLVGSDGRLELALRVWGGSSATVKYWGGGPFGGKFSLGDYSTQLLGNISNNIPSLVLCGLFLAFGLNHLYLYQRNRQLKLYLWFGLTAVNIAVYSLMLTQWKFLLPLTFETLKTIEFGAVYLLPAIALQMIWALLGIPVRPWVRAYQLSFLAFAFIGMANPWPDTRPLSLMAYEIWILPAFIFIPGVIWKSMQAGNNEARTLFLGLIVFGATCVNDILIDMARLDNPRIIHYGFAVLMLAMAVSVGNRFTAMLNRLEREIEEHTEELREANEQLAAVARLDPLTGLLNRRGLIADAEKEIQRVNRGSPGFTIILADIDHFKSVNDRHGHTCGDQALRRLAGLLRQRLREVDILGRWGGEEFIMVLPETDGDGATVVAEYLRHAVETAHFDYQGNTLPLTMTFGISPHRKGESLETTINRADAALYQGKETGRNRVTVNAYQGLSVIS